MLKNIKKKELFIAIFILLIGVILSLGIKSYFDNVYANNKSQEEIPFTAHLAGCKKGECTEYVDTQDQYKATFECLGEMEGLLYWNTKTIDLNNGNVLIYQLGSTFPGELNIKDYRATLLNLPNRKFSKVNYYDSYFKVQTHYQIPFRQVEDIDYILKRKNYYYLSPYVHFQTYNGYLFDTNNNEETLTFLYKDMPFRFCYQGTFLTSMKKDYCNTVSCDSINGLQGFKGQISAYEQIIKNDIYPSRKLFRYYGDEPIQIMFVKTINHQMNLYAANCKHCEWPKVCTKVWKDCNQVFLEDPVNLKRSKYGLLNEPIDFLASEIISKDKLYLISANNIELFNPETGNVQLIMTHKPFAGKIYSLLLNDKKIFVLSPETKQYLVFSPETNKITASGKIDSLFDNSDYADTYDITMLKNGKVFIYGLTMELYDPDTDKYYTFKDQPTKRMGAKLTLLKDGKVLITGGFLDNVMAKRFLNQKDGFIYNSAELLTIESNKEVK